MEVNENRGRLCRKKLQGKIRKKKNHQKEKDITGSVKRANHNKGSMIVSDPTELVQPGGNNHSSRFVRLCVGACFIHGAGWHTLHSLSASGKRDSEKRKIIWKPVKAPLGIDAKERGMLHLSKHRLGVRQCPFLQLCGSRHTFVPNSFWAMVCRRTIPLLRKILMNEGIKNGSLYQNLELNSYFCIRRVLWRLRNAQKDNAVDN